MPINNARCKMGVLKIDSALLGLQLFLTSTSSCELLDPERSNHKRPQRFQQRIHTYGLNEILYYTT